MLISKRRLQWGTILGLIMLAMLLIRPARSWVDQAFARNIIDGHLTVDAIKFHRSASVVQVDRVRWSRENDGRSFGFAADSAWLAIDVESLIDRKIRIPRARVENAELFLRDDSARANPSTSNWRQVLRNASSRSTGTTSRNTSGRCFPRRASVRVGPSESSGGSRARGTY